MPIEKFTYAVREKTVDGVAQYYAAFTNGDGLPQEAEIPYEVYLALVQFRREERRQANIFSRHLEHLELSEAQLAARMLMPPLPMEEAVAQTADMQAALAVLTETQRRRFLLYYEHGLTYEQIAHVEGCAYSATVKSIASAKEKVQKFISGEGDKTGV